jgi:hypothetical protein
MILMLKKFFLFVVLSFCITAFTACDDDSIFYAKVKTANGITTVSGIRAGGLERAFLIGLGSVKHLVINDTIDSRDFQTMRDEMPNLAVLDLSNATIVAYNGSEGSAGSRVYHYSADAIPEFAFYNPFTSLGKKSLTSIILPKSLKSIRDYAFNSTGLSGTLNIPASVRDTIGKNAFSFCEDLTAINLPSASYIGESAFQACSNLAGALVIPDSVFKIKPFAFAYCEKISSISISKTVNSIGNTTFLNCGGNFTVNAENLDFSAINGVLFNADKSTIVRFPFNKSGIYTLPETVGDIAPYSFANCSAVIKVTLPAGTFIIEDFAFSECKALTEVNIPEGIFYIGNSAFLNCSSLSRIYVKPTTPIDLTETVSAFSGVNKSNCTLYVPIGSKSSYANAVGWSSFSKIVEN